MRPGGRNRGFILNDTDQQIAGQAQAPAKKAPSAAGARLSEKGLPWEEIERELRALKTQDFDGLRGRLPAYFYYFNEQVLDVQKRAYCEYILENGLGAETAFPSLETMQSALFEMAYALFHAPGTAGAAFTSGGTISVIDAVKTARDKARAERGKRYGVFNIIAPFSAHPCLNKAGELLDVEIRRIPLDRHYRADVEAMRRAVDADTILLYGSAPCYPFGVFDPIGELSALALDRRLWLHVDACWGGFLSPFAKQLGYPVPVWDFEHPGVSSLSADLHKHGYAVKGASLLIFRDKSVQRYQRFDFSEWHRGTYASPSIAGSSPGGAISAAYAVMRFLGEAGYREIAAATMGATVKWIKGVNQIEGLRCFEPNGESSLFGFYSTDPTLDILAVAEGLKKRGWLPETQHRPLRDSAGRHRGSLPHRR